MNKMIKGSVAGATGIVLLMGGFGTYALWSDSADMEASKVTSGQLDIKAGDVTWDGNGDWEIGDLVVPGDVVTRTQEFTIKGTGKNLKGAIDFTQGAVDKAEFANAGTNGADGPANWLDVDVDLTVSNGVATEAVPGSNQFTFSSPFNTQTVTAVVTYTFDVNAEGVQAQRASATLENSGLVIRQTRS
jgi:alternate signal-mediated exported protein